MARSRLEEARRTAGEWRSLIAKGIDPAVVEAEAREKAARERALRIRHSFANAAEAFIADKLAQERSGKDGRARLPRRTSSPHGATARSAKSPSSTCWRSSTRKKRTAPQMARALLVLIKRFFNWCIDQHVYGLDHSPCDRLNRAKIIGEPQIAQPTPHRRRAVRVLAGHRADEVPGRSGLSHAAAHRAAAQRVRAAIVAGSSGRHHHHPGVADEGQGRQGARTSGAAVVGGAGGHRVAAAHRERAVPVLASTRASVRWR